MMERPNFKQELLSLAIVAVVAFAVFAPSLGGDFVYDDKRQVAENPLIQNPALYSQALLSDVWAFKGDGTISASNYWRPTFTALSIINFRLFGLEPFGWHLINVLLHVGVCLLAYWFLRRLGMGKVPSLAVTILFAVHPVHTESVAWVAGSPDLLFSASLLASLIFADRVFTKQGKPLWIDIAIASILYAAALGSKEVALLCLPLYYLLWAFRREDTGPTATVAVWKPMFGIMTVIAFVYFVVRWSIVGSLSRPAEDSASLASALMSAPLVFAFYLHQTLFPIILATNYSIRPVTSPGLFNFVLPLVACLVAGAAIFWAWRRGGVERLAVAIFVLPLIPVFNIIAFPPEQIVHDRYLYLPLLGACVLLVTVALNIAAKFFGERANTALIVAAVAISIPLFIKTVSYSRVWATDLTLWQQAVTVDSSSASNWSQLGAILSEKKQTADSIAAYDRSIEIRSTPLALMGRARGYIASGRFDDAVRDSKAVVQTPLDSINAYTLFQSYETLGQALERSGQAAEAERVFREARTKLPIYAATITEKLAVVLYQQNRKAEALTELINIRDQAGREMLIDAKVVYFRLGLLYGEQGNIAEAKRNLQDFVAATSNTRSPVIVGYRNQSIATLNKLK